MGCFAGTVRFLVGGHGHDHLARCIYHHQAGAAHDAAIGEDVVGVEFEGANHRPVQVEGQDSPSTLDGSGERGDGLPRPNDVEVNSLYPPQPP